MTDRPPTDRDDEERFLRRLTEQLRIPSHDAEDLIQQTWIVDLEKGGGIGQRRAWLARVLRNRWIDLCRARRARQFHEGVRKRSVEGLSQAADGRFEAVAESVSEAADRLREPYKSAIRLRYYHGLSAQEVARRTEVSVNTVKTRIRRGLALLRMDLQGVNQVSRRNPWSMGWAWLLGRRADRELVGTAVEQRYWLIAAVGSAVVSVALLGVGIRGLDAHEVELPALSVRSEPPVDRSIGAPQAGPRRTVEPLDSPLSPPAERTLTVRVDGPDGLPVEGAQVVLFQGWNPTHQSDGYAQPARHGLTDSEGRLTLANLPPRYHLFATKGAWISSETIVSFVHNDEVPLVELELAPSRTIVGRIVGEDGEPVAGATVGSMGKPTALGMQAVDAPTIPTDDDSPYRLNRTLHFTESDADGQFRLGPLTGSAYTLQIAAPDYSPSTAYVGPTEDQVLVELERPCSLQFEIASAANRPIVDAEVEVFWAAKRELSVPVGHYLQVEGLPSSGVAFARIRADGHGPHVVGPLALRPGEVRVNASLEQPRSLSIEVLLADGRPARGAYVRARYVNCDGPSRVQDPRAWNARLRATTLAAERTDASGSLVLHGLPADEIELEVATGQDWSNAHYELVERDRTVARVRLGAREASVLVEGQLLDGTSGLPMEHTSASVTAWGMESTYRHFASRVSNQGRFELALPREDAWTLVFHANGFSPRSRRVRQGGLQDADPLDLFPSRTRQILLRSASGRPMTNQWIQFEELDGSPAWCQARPSSWKNQVRTDRMGRAQVRGLPTARLRVRIQPPGLRPEEILELDLQGDATDPIVLTLETPDPSGAQSLEIELQERPDASNPAKPLNADYRATIRDQDGQLVNRWSGAVRSGTRILDPESQSLHMEVSRHGMVRVWNNRIGREDPFNASAVQVDQPHVLHALVPPEALQLRVEAVGYEPWEEWVTPGTGAGVDVVLQRED